MVRKLILPIIAMLCAGLAGCGSEIEHSDQATSDENIAEIGQAAGVTCQTTAPQFPLPVGYWSFDRCDTVNGKSIAMDDTQGQRLITDAAMNNGAICSSGRYGSSAYFDGVDDRADIADNARFNFTTAMTVTAWVKPSITTGSRNIINKWYTKDSYMLSLQSGNFVFSVALPGGTWGIPVNASTPATAGVWSHVAGVFNGSTISIYVNGQFKASASAAGSLQASTRPLVIGNHPAGNAFQGRIDEVKLYNVALTSTQIANLATPPSTLGVRGLHLISDHYAANQYDSSLYPCFVNDLSRIQTITNINSVKTTIFTRGNDPTHLQIQSDKLTKIKAAAGNHVTWVLRAWPMTPSMNAGWVDLTPGSNYYDQGRLFAHALAPVFAAINHPDPANTSTLRLNNVFVEVANEPNIAAEGFTFNNWPAPSAYNDFFRGFYDGEREVGYSFPLIYAGLSPGLDDGAVGRYSSDAWYQDYWVQYHINNYADKIGAHSYWEGSLAANNRTNPIFGGWYYRRVHDLLAGGVTPKGILVTEFNGRRTTFPGLTTDAKAANQAADFCQWWREAAQAASQGYWTEQTLLWVTNHVDRGSAGDIDITNNYVVRDNQVNTITTCQ